MNDATVFLIVFAIGLVCGLRSLTGPAVVSWANYLGWIHLAPSRLDFLGSSGLSVIVVSAAALGELIVDKLPNTPSRTAPFGLIARLVLGGLCGAALCATAGRSQVIGAALGALGGLAGAFGGYQARTRLSAALNVPDFVVAVIEDAVAIGGGLLLVSPWSLDLSYRLLR